ncbi:t-SNARE domain-containing protein 1 [Polypterus senegalus]|uniref:t-SNARE domain-containing protein 1 n=1 Tax=Polypterus senegalus TaxID=55291 RepID=UPI0019627577|nr:t-SNARE domain-containing protein 1 [Polypterus senegalus]
MSYGSIDGGPFGSRNPFGGPTRLGYQPVATQVSPTELQDVFQETSSNIFQINANVVALEKSLQWLGTSRDTPELRETLHATQQQTNGIITSTSQLVKQLSEIISGSRQDHLRLTRIKNEFSESVQRYGDVQKKIAEKSRALLPTTPRDNRQSPRTPLTEPSEDDRIFTEGEMQGRQEEQAFLSEITEEDMEVLRQREEELIQIERDMLDVSQIVKDLASLVHEQGSTIDSIEDYIQSSSTNVDTANQELAKANRYQKQARKKKCCLIVAGIVVLTFLVIIISVSVRK